MAELLDNEYICAAKINMPGTSKWSSNIRVTPDDGHDVLIYTTLFWNKFDDRIVILGIWSDSKRHKSSIMGLSCLCSVYEGVTASAIVTQPLVILTSMRSLYFLSYQTPPIPGVSPTGIFG